MSRVSDLSVNSSEVATPDWGIGPFNREDAINPLFRPHTTKHFLCPMQGTAVVWEKAHVFNPAAIVKDGRVCLIYRAEDGSGHGLSGHTSRLSLAVSADGLHFQSHSTPVLYPDDDSQRCYEWPGGCEDPRLVEAEDGLYVLTYTQWDRHVARLAVATSHDLIHWDKHGPAFAHAAEGRFLNCWSKAGAILTQRIGDRLKAVRVNGKYHMYWGEGSIYAAVSDDLLRWDPVLNEDQSLRVLLAPRPHRFDSMLCEPGPPALLTDQGVLLLYNGKNDDSINGQPDSEAGIGAYSMGQALFDPESPTRPIARTDRHLLTPARHYERSGQYHGGTVFVQGLVPFAGRWLLYYGAADSVICVAACAIDSRSFCR